MREDFRDRLRDLEDGLAAAAEQVLEVLAAANGPLVGLPSGDDVRSTVVAVQRRCQRAEDEGFVLLAREAPVGRDLRRLVAVLRGAVDVERAATLTLHIADHLAGLEVATLPAEARSPLGEMARAAAGVLRRGVDAWRRRDALAVIDVDRADRAVDDLHLRLLEAASHSDAVHGETRIALGLLARYYERLADHGVALARDAAFVVTGERVSR